MRVRDTHRWGIGKLYPSKREFLDSSVSSGLHTIQAGNLLLDILVRNRGSDTTLIFFHASVTKSSTFPVLVGDGLAEAANANLISISDPTLAYTDKLRLGWYIGIKPLGSFPNYAKSLLHHAVECLNTKRVILAGSSGGGYAAVNFSRFFSDAAVLCINPRLNLATRPTPNLGEFLVHAYKASGRTQVSRLKATYVQENAANFYPKALTNHIGILQNTGDTDYYEGQFIPFCQELSPDPKLWTRTDGIGDGHVPYPKEILHTVVQNLADLQYTVPVAYQKSGFQNHGA